MDELQVLELLERCSNAGRWGPDDDLGTLNYITPAKRVEAASLVRVGKSVSLGRDLSRAQSRANPTPVVLRMLFFRRRDPTFHLDSVELVSHGYSVTHLDAFGHADFEGTMYNGRRADECVTADGLTFGSIHALRDGIFTRGVLLDVARARGVDWLEPEEGILPADLERAERFGGATAGSGDAILVRIGLAAREAARGEEDPSHRAGLMPECIPWLHDRQVAVYGGDCIERIPLPYARIPLPLHTVGLVAMGLVFLDNPTMEELSAVAASVGRYEFLLACAPLRLAGGTASPVNPVAVF